MSLELPVTRFAKMVKGMYGTETLDLFLTLVDAEGGDPSVSQLRKLAQEAYDQIHPDEAKKRDSKKEYRFLSE